MPCDPTRCCIEQQPDETWPETVLVADAEGRRHYLPLATFLRRPCALATVWPHVIGIIDFETAAQEIRAAALIEGCAWEEEEQ